MFTPTTSITSTSGQLTLECYSNPTFVVSIYRNLSHVTVAEYLDHIKITGNYLAEAECGKLIADFSALRNYSISLRAAAVNNLKQMILQKVPYFLVGVIKSNNSFDNLATEAALKAARPLSKKFLDGKMFDNRVEAFDWVIGFPIPKNI